MASPKPDKVKVKTPGRRRVATGLTLLLLGLLAAGVWAASGWWRLERRQGGVYLGVAFGLLSGGRQDTYEFYESPWTLERLEDGVGYWWYLPSEEDNPHFDRSLNLFLANYNTGRWYPCDWNVVLWPIPLLLWTPAALLLRSGILARRRAMTGSCAKCGYSLAGLGDDAKCPECGKASAAGAVNTPASGE